VIFNEGISQLGELIDIGNAQGIVDKSGAWYSFKGERLGQGREGAKVFLKEHPEVADEIRGLILETLGISNAANRSKDGAKNPGLKVVSGDQIVGERSAKEKKKVEPERVKTAV
jgi:hypothetical protein